MPLVVFIILFCRCILIVEGKFALISHQYTKTAVSYHIDKKKKYNKKSEEIKGMVCVLDTTKLKRKVGGLRRANLGIYGSRFAIRNHATPSEVASNRFQF